MKDTIFVSKIFRVKRETLEILHGPRHSITEKIDSDTTRWFTANRDFEENFISDFCAGASMNGA